MNIRRTSLALALPTILFSAILLSAALPRSTAWGEEAGAIDRRLKESAEYLASDELEGRGVGTEGLNKAADYIAAQFKQLGLKTEVFDGSPFQTFQMTTGAKLGEVNHLTLSGPDGKQIELKLNKNFSPLALGGSGKLEEMPLVFAGYGITAKDYGYDDFANLDVKDKAVVLIRKEPQQANPHSQFDGSDSSQHAYFSRKISNAYQHGARAVIIVNDLHTIEQNIKQTQERAERAEKALQEFKKKLGDKKPSEEQAEELKKLERNLAAAQRRVKQIKRDPLVGFKAAGTSSERDVPVLSVTRATFDPIIKAAVGKDLTTIEKEIDGDLKPQSKPLDGWTLSGVVSVERTQVDVKNVVGVLEGEGPLADETVVVGAHYDHLGYGGAGSFVPNKKEIHNGADDNGSGTATLLEVARQVVAAGRPKRRIVFIAFTGEETGLIGSAYYAKKPPFDMEKTVAMLNMDMVGRLVDDKLIIQGIDTGKEFQAWIDEHNKKYGLKITAKEGGSGPSDHTSFYTRGVPVMHFFTGTHKDYHRPSDDADKLNIDGMRRIGLLVADIALEVADTEKRPEYVKVVSTSTVPRGDGERPYFGSIPDFAGEGKGYKLMGVTKGGPAEKGGLKAGDTVVKLGEYDIANLEDIDSALRKFKGGDKVKVKVLRDKKEVTLEVTLGDPR